VIPVSLPEFLQALYYAAAILVLVLRALLLWRELKGTIGRKGQRCR
jgi:hypothetical protein